MSEVLVIDANRCLVGESLALLPIMKSLAARVRTPFSARTER